MKKVEAHFGYVDWSRLAEPQNDGYDTEVALQLAEAEKGWQRPSAIESPTFCDGRVGLRPWPFSDDDELLLRGKTEHPNLYRAEKYIKDLWPTSYEQFARLICEVYPMTPRDTKNEGGIGSFSGHSTVRPFTIYVTYFDPFGTAESMLHEMAHIKLRCFGVHVESCTRLILNAHSELYVSPLRSFKRPMTAVVHAFYSWLHLTELDLRLASCDPQRARVRLERNCKWIDEMLNEIQSHVCLDDVGEVFFHSLYAWADQVLAKGRRLLASQGASPL